MTLLCVAVEAYPSIHSILHLPSFASANLGCVAFRSKKKLAPVRVAPYILYCYCVCVNRIGKLISVKDVTTRGNYYPDKSMATPGVSELVA